MTYSFIIPAYNEEKTIRPAAERVLAYASGLGGDFEIIVVDDGSTDGTAQNCFRVPSGRLKPVNENWSKCTVRHPTGVCRPGTTRARFEKRD